MSSETRPLSSLTTARRTACAQPRFRNKVIRTLDGPLAPIACASRTAYQPCRDCKSVKACSVRLAMTRVRDAMSDVLDELTLAEMVANGQHRPAAKAARRKRAAAR